MNNELDLYFVQTVNECNSHRSIRQHKWHEYWEFYTLVSIIGYFACEFHSRSTLMVPGYSQTLFFQTMPTALNKKIAFLGAIPKCCTFTDCSVTVSIPKCR